MGMKMPRGKFERRDVLLSAKIWRTRDKMDSPVASTCRNVGARGCRLIVEDAKMAPNFDVDLPIYFLIDLSWKWNRPPKITGLSSAPQESSSLVEGAGHVAWLKREHGEFGKIRLTLGVEFAAVSFEDREKIKAYIASLPEPTS